MNALIFGEYSGRVRQAMLRRGHFAVSCDLLPAEDSDPDELHYQGDGWDLIREPWRMLPGGQGYCGRWDMMVAHPPCTYLTVAAQRWQNDHWVKRKKGNRWHDGAAHRQGRADAYEFFMALWNCDIPKIAIENPVGVMSSLWRKPDQIIHPWQFGHPEFKATCLWLKGLPPLVPTNVLTPPPRDSAEGRAWSKVHRAAPGPDRWKERSRTYQGIADAMAEQWG